MATVVTNVGLAEVTLALSLSGDNKYVAWGTGVGTAAVTDTTLFTEAAETRVSGTVTQETTTATDDTYRVVATIVSASGQTITNAGIFDATTTGNLFVKGDFTGIALLTSESIQFTIDTVVS